MKGLVQICRRGHVPEEGVEGCDGRRSSGGVNAKRRIYKRHLQRELPSRTTDGFDFAMHIRTGRNRSQSSD